ncbi:MAG: DNA gyrase inhibitor YacG [Planctomycetota bacterium]
MNVLRRARCPTCKKPVPVAPEERTQDFPFCSERCRLVDLHRWLSETYRIPVAEPPPPEEK